MEQEKEITVLPSQEMSTTQDLEAAIKTAERTEELVRKIKILAIKQTNKHDWIDQAGKPYLQASGAEKIARLFGISWRICSEYPKKETISDENGNYYMYVYKGEFTMGGKSIEVVGTCSQKDKFFGKTKEGLKPLSEIDECNISRKAYTNMVGRGIKTILGIRSLTWEEVNGGNIKQSDIAKVEYSQGSKGGKAMSEIVGIVSNYTVKEGTGKSGKPYKFFVFELIDKNNNAHNISTFDDKKIQNGFEVKASELESKEYNGKITYSAKKVEIVSENDGIEF